MRFVVCGMIAAAIIAMPAHAQVMSWQGVGPVNLGMTVAEAERALNGKLEPMGPPFSEECWVTRRADGKDEALYYVVVNGKIVVMTVSLPDGKQPDPNIVDKNGVGVGSTETDIIMEYGPVKKDFAPYFHVSKESLAEAAKERAKRGITEPEPPPHFSIEVESSDHQRVIIFETLDEKVLNLRIGFKPEVLAWEDCI